MSVTTTSSLVVMCGQNGQSFKDVTGVATFSLVSCQSMMPRQKMAEGSLKKASTMLRKIQSGKKALAVDTEFLKFFNNYVKAGRPSHQFRKAYNEFFYHLGGEYSKVIKKNKTLKAQANKAGKFIDAVEFLETNEKGSQDGHCCLHEPPVCQEPVG